MSAVTDFFDKIRGTLTQYFQFGKDGAQAKNTGTGSLDLRNATDTGFAVLRVAAPVGNDDAVNKLFLDSVIKPTIVKRQADCSTAIPTNTGVSGFVVVTTAGNGAVIGDLLRDNGSGTGAMEIYSAEEGRTIAITVALTGGAIALDADSLYIWDLQGTVWKKIGDVSNSTGSIRVIRIPFTNANGPSYDGAYAIPANARILESRVAISVAFSAGATISLGYVGATAAFAATTDNVPQSLGTYRIAQDTAADTVDRVLRITIGGTPSVGTGVAILTFVVPNA